MVQKEVWYYLGQELAEFTLLGETLRLPSKRLGRMPRTPFIHGGVRKCQKKNQLPQKMNGNLRGTRQIASNRPGSGLGILR
jgi:hypothetical protein